MEEPGAEQSGKQKREERSRRRLVDGQSTEQHKRGNEQNAADADRAYQKTDDDGDRGEQCASDQVLCPAGNALHFFQPIICLKRPSSSSFMNTVCSLPG
jgi:hypothetical protein